MSDKNIKIIEEIQSSGQYPTHGSVKSTTKVAEVLNKTLKKTIKTTKIVYNASKTNDKD